MSESPYRIVCEEPGRYRIYGIDGPTRFWRNSESQLQPILKELLRAYSLGILSQQKEIIDRQTEESKVGAKILANALIEIEMLKGRIDRMIVQYNELKSKSNVSASS